MSKNKLPKLNYILTASKVIEIKTFIFLTLYSGENRSKAQGILTCEREKIYTYKNVMYTNKEIQ